MRIFVKLYASLEEYLPAGATDNPATLDLADGTTPTQLLLRLGLSEAICGDVLVNGTQVPPDERSSQRLEDDDLVAIWPAGN